MITARLPPAALALADGLVLGLPVTTGLTRSSRAGVMLASWPAPRRVRHRRPGPAEPIGKLLARKTTKDEPDIVGPISPPAPREQHRCMSRRHTQSAPFDRAPLLRFSSPSTLTGLRCAARSGRAADDPASAFLVIDPTRASAEGSANDVALAVLRPANTMR